MHLRSGKTLLEVARPNTTLNTSSTSASYTQSNIQSTQEQSTQEPVFDSEHQCVNCYGSN